MSQGFAYHCLLFALLGLPRVNAMQYSMQETVDVFASQLGGISIVKFSTKTWH